MVTVVQVYMDGSGYEGYAGAVAFLVRTDGVHNERCVLRYCLGPLLDFFDHKFVPGPPSPENTNLYDLLSLSPSQNKLINVHKYC